MIIQTNSLCPSGCGCYRIRLESASGPLDWWRVEDKTGAILGSGFSRMEAVDDAWKELLRREENGQ